MSIASAILFLLCIGKCEKLFYTNILKISTGRKDKMLNYQKYIHSMKLKEQDVKYVHMVLKWMDQDLIY